MLFLYLGRQFMHIFLNLIISFLETGKKSLNDGAIPKLNLPEKSHESRKFMERQHRDIVQEDIKLSEENIPLYKSFTEFANRIRK